LGACQSGAINIKAGECPNTDAVACSLSADCVNVCPTNARRIVGDKAGIDEIMNAVLKDSVFYDESGGGVTFSGGEPLVQSDFLKGMLARCRQEGLHTAVDTCLYANKSVLDDILPFTNLFLCDIKHVASEKHKEWTGVDNGIILENLQYLSRSGIELVIRIPVVPGFNDTPAEINQIASFIASIDAVKQINLLAYNTGGVSKGKRLLNPHNILQCKLPDVDKMNELEDVVASFGFQVKEGMDNE
jgi:pyruvate formate lyase activating enzyme